jgi:ankyrin repeat protein
LCSCWDREPTKRPSFRKILEIFDCVLNFEPDIFESAERGDSKLIKTIIQRHEHSEPIPTHNTSHSSISVDSSIVLHRQSPLSNFVREAQSQTALKFNSHTDPKAIVSRRDKFGRTPLIYAVIIGDLNLVKYLVAVGALVDIRDEEYKTVMHYATLHSRTEILSYLCNFLAKEQSHDTTTTLRAVIDAKDSLGMTPLHYSCVRGDKEVGDYSTLSWTCCHFRMRV